MATRNGRSILSFRRNQVVSMGNSENSELGLFQTRVAERFISLCHGERASNESELERPRENKKSPEKFVLPIDFLLRLMDLFLSCDEEFRALVSLFLSQQSAANSNAGRVVSDHLERLVKSLDICNAVTQSLDSLCHAQRYASIAADALLAQKPIGEPNFNRARSALRKLLPAICERPTERTSSMGRSRKGFAAAAAAAGADATPSTDPGCSRRTLSLSLSKNWSAGKQVQAMATTLHLPRGGEGSALALAFYTMSSIQVFVMWVIVAAFPSQERCPAPGLPTPPRHLPWAEFMTTLQERVVEEWKMREKKGAAAVMPSGMMSEIQELERCGKRLVEFPAEEDQTVEVTATAKELAEVCRAMDKGAVVLQMKVREVFHRIVRSRKEVLGFRSQGSTISASPGS